MTPKFIIDKEIVNLTSEGYGTYGKILNRFVTTQNLTTVNGDPCQLYSDVTDGTLLALNYGNGIMAKVFTVDRPWNRIVWFDQDLMGPPFSRSFGGQG